MGWIAVWALLSIVGAVVTGGDYASGAVWGPNAVRTAASVLMTVGYFWKYAA